jgi:CheY-like chemotaxis protein
MAKLLLLDDDPATLAWMRAALETLGHEVRIAEVPLAAVELARSFTPDLIIADIMMPEIDGLAFARMIRRLRGAPVMFVSIAKREAEAVLAGAVGYVQKPATPQEIRAAVERVLGRRHAPSTVLIVDDDDETRELFSDVLGSEFSTLEAADGAAALELLRRRPVDLVVTDVHMPAMNGAELLHAIRADPALERLPVIVQTGDPNALGAPVWRDLNAALVVGKKDFVTWLGRQIDDHLGWR